LDHEGEGKRKEREGNLRSVKLLVMVPFITRVGWGKVLKWKKKRRRLVPRGRGKERRKGKQNKQFILNAKIGQRVVYAREGRGEKKNPSGGIQLRGTGKEKRKRAIPIGSRRGRGGGTKTGRRLFYVPERPERGEGRNNTTYAEERGR